MRKKIGTVSYQKSEVPVWFTYDKNLIMIQYNPTKWFKWKKMSKEMLESFYNYYGIKANILHIKNHLYGDSYKVNILLELNKPVLLNLLKLNNSHYLIFKLNQTQMIQAYEQIILEHL